MSTPILPNISETPHKIEAYGEVTPGPNTIELVITFPPGSDPREVEYVRKQVANALKAAVRQTKLSPLTEQRIYT